MNQHYDYIDSLTDRETDILRLKVKRQSNKEIADTLFLSRNTVRWYISQIYSKVDVSNRRELIKRVQELNLLDDVSEPGLSPQIQGDIELSPIESLTEREGDVLMLLCDGYTNAQIGKTLTISIGTVKSHVHNICQKLGVKTRTQAVLTAKKIGLVAKSEHPVSTLKKQQLPKRWTSFIGRHREIEDMCDQLSTTRLLTLTGTGGTGKTRLSLTIAEQIKGQYSDGIFFIDLSPISDASQVAKTIAGILGLIENTNETITDTICKVLSDQNTLLIIDNFEHVLTGASVISDILQGTNKVKIIITSREPLGLYGESEYHVPTLALPDATGTTPFTDLMQNEAVQLFAQRAKSANRMFKLTPKNIQQVTEICRQLDGLPLAIELAAARSKVLNPQALLARLNKRLDILTMGSGDLPRRQQTIRNTIAWSYELLTKDEKKLFMRLAVFRGGRSIEACEAVCMDGLSLDVLGGLTSLVNKSLVIQREDNLGHPRFWMLETIQEFALEHLAEDEASNLTHQRHADYFLQLAEYTKPELRRPQQKHWIIRLEIELENIRTALQWLLDNEIHEQFVHLIIAMCDFWNMRVYQLECESWLAKAKPYIHDVAAFWRGMWYVETGYSRWRVQSDILTTRTFAIKGYRIGKEADDKFLMAYALRYMAGSGAGLPDLMNESLEYGHQSVAFWQELDNKPQLAHSVNTIAQLYQSFGMLAEAHEYFTKAISIAQEVGDIRRTVVNMINLSATTHELHRHEEAKRIAQDVLRLAQSQERYDIIARILGKAVSPINEPDHAIRLIAASETLMKSTSLIQLPSTLPNVQMLIELARNQVDTKTFTIDWEEGSSLSFDEAVAYALDEIDPFEIR